MKSPTKLASVLFIAAAIGLWACQHAAQNERPAAALERLIMASP